MRLELVPIPVSDIDEATSMQRRSGSPSTTTLGPRAECRPTDAAGFVLFDRSDKGLPALSAEPGSMSGLHLVVDDIDAVRKALVDCGVVVEEVADIGRGVRMAGFADPDGNTWALQQMP